MVDDERRGQGSDLRLPASAARTPQRASATAPQQANSLVPSLSLPKGGGAIRGIGEKFSTNPSTGTGALVVPIATSKGRGGFELGLELSYDSGAGNGPFGLGWRLSAPSITRKTDRGLPRYFDGQTGDVFILSGAEDLVRVPFVDSNGIEADSGTASESGIEYRIERYRPRTEGLFARIERWTDPTSDDAHWRALTRENLLNVYGRTAGARISDPKHAGRVFSWLLEETRDDRGNVARYSYKSEDGSGVSAAKVSEANRFDSSSVATSTFLVTSQRYLKRIQYGNVKAVSDRTAPLPSGDGDYLFEVVFDYGEHDEATPTPDEIQPWSARSDPFSSYRATFEVRSYRLCRRVLMFHRFAELGDAACLVRSTDLTFVESNVLSEDGTYSDGPMTNYLVAITHAGYVLKSDGTYQHSALPPLSLEYSRPIIHDDLRAMDPDSVDGIAHGVEGSGAQWVDLNGEGVPGVLLTTDRVWHYKENQGDGHLAPPSPLDSLPVASALNSGSEQLIDIGGDGNLDLVRYTQPLAGYFERTSEGGWQPFVALRSVPNIDWDDPNLRFVDLDGDGFPDILVTEHDVFVWYRSRAKDGFESAAFVAKPKDERFGPAIVFADGSENISLADMTGDGLVDIVRVRNGDVCYWPNLGYGTFGRQVTLDQSPRFDAPDRFDPKRVRFADLDGSGTSDIVYLGRDGVRLYFNQSGNGLTEPFLIRTFGPVDSASSLSVVDLLGQGTACLVWSSPLATSQSRPVAYVDLMGAQKPHMLVSVLNNLGGETRIAYAQSTQFYLADKAAGKPWLTRLAFPVQVVGRIEHYDRIANSKLVTRFSYHHGYFDGYEREFRGFARVEQWDSESFGEEITGLFPGLPYDVDPSDPDLNLPPVRTVTWFHTGAWLERERLERALSREYYGGAWLDGPPATGVWQDYFGRDPKAQDPHAADFFLPDTVFELDPLATGTPDQFSVADQREATRALRGQVLRQEIYAEDGTDGATHPYSVSERNYQVRRIQPVVGETHGVFFSHALNSINLHYERGYLDSATTSWVNDDPRIQHDLVLDVDAHGNVTRSATVGYPRRDARRATEEGMSEELLTEQARMWLTITDRLFANQPNASTWYRIGVPCETSASELTGLVTPTLGPLSGDDVASGVKASSEIAYEVPASTGLQRRVVERQRTLYYDEHTDLAGFQSDAVGLGLGQISQFALAHQTYRQVLTPGLVAQVYGVSATDAVLQSEGFYVELDGTWWAPSGRSVPDPAAFYLPVEVVDAFSQHHLIQYDRYSLLVVDTEDPLQNRVTAGLRDTVGNVTLNGNDYRVLAPSLVCDANRNRSAVAFDPLGMVTQLWRMGVDGATDGDTQALPGVVFQYDLTAFLLRKEPTLAHAATREVHQAGGDPFQSDGTPQRQGWQHARTYSDGSGREALRKVQAEPGPVPTFNGGQLVRGANGTPETHEESNRWVGTGRTVFDNKGNPIKRYEPFFSDTLDYEDEKELVQWGVTPILRYDPLGRLIRTDQPNQTLARVVFGPWKQETWDENDTVLEGQWYAIRGNPDPQAGVPAGDEGRAAWLAAHHANTPTIAHLDSLGRIFLTIADNGSDPAGAARKYPTRVNLDVEGNQLLVTDARGIPTHAQVFDVLGRAIQITSADAGRSFTLFDAENKPIRTSDPRGYTARNLYDALQRRTHSFVRNGNDPEALCERTVYGETHPEAELRNLRGRAYQAYDGAGAFTNARFEFKGNPSEVSRRLALEYHDTPDWSVLATLTTTTEVEAASDALLEKETFTTTATFDALSRVISSSTPDGSTSSKTYNQAGLLETISIAIRGAAATSFVKNIDYNARGQRELIELGNGAATTYEYDTETFRLEHQVTRVNGGPALQDLTYTHDPVGNVVAIRDAVSYGNANVSGDGTYEYDPVYQLVSATGREHPGQQPTDADAAELGLPLAAHPNDWQALTRYVETYTYDAVGNILEMSHQPVLTSGAGAWDRRYNYPNDSNRLAATSIPADAAGAFSAKYSYDSAGNMVAMPHLPEMNWDYANRLQHVKKQVVNGEAPPNDVYYAYDSSGQRVRKVYEHGGLVEESIYLRGYEVYRKTTSGEIQVERQTLEAHDLQGRIALIETKTIDVFTPGFTVTTRQRYQIEGHLESSMFELDDAGGVISYEEYYPYGSSSFAATDSSVEVSAKRYRYTGKERDEETALYYYGARYYAAWLGRWTSPDPKGLVDGTNLFAYARDNPTRFGDPRGTEASDGHGGAGTAAAQAIWRGRAVPLSAAAFDAAKRDLYKAANTEASTAASGFVENAAKTGQVSEAATVARSASDLRNVLRTTTQSELTLIGKWLSRLLDKGQTWAKIVRSKGDPFDASSSTAQRFEAAGKIAKGVGNSNWKMNALQGLGKVVLGVSAAFSANQIREGAQQIAHGEAVKGGVNVAGGIGGLTLTVGTYAATKAGLIVNEAGAAAGSLTMIAGVAAGGALWLAGEETRRSLSGEKTMAVEAAEFYADLTVDGQKQGGLAGAAKQTAGYAGGLVSTLIAVGQGYRP